MFTQSVSEFVGLRPIGGRRRELRRWYIGMKSFGLLGVCERAKPGCLFPSYNTIDDLQWSYNTNEVEIIMRG